MKDGKFDHDVAAASSKTKVFDLFSLKGRTAIVSGAGAGIGLGVAHAYAEAGANVIIWYNSNAKAIERAKEIEAEYGVKCRAFQVDVTSAEAVEAAVTSQIKEFNNRLDVFVANAGIPWTQGPAIDGELEHYRKVVANDLDSVFYCARTCGRIWRRQRETGLDLAGDRLEGYGGGSFVATASMSGHIVNVPQLQAAYNAAKAGVSHMCKSFAVEWVGFARANAVSPGYIATEISTFVSEDTKKIWKDKIPMG
ncbi:Sorbose reductase sou1 [Diaporthe eres]